MFNLYNTTTLLDVIRVQPVVSSYWLDSFFGRSISFDTEEIMFDKVTNIRRIAPFVSPVVQGRVMRTRGYETRTFRPAYTKPKHIVDPNRQFVRMAGEGIGGEMTPAQRWNTAVSENMREEREAITRLWNWMAAMATIHGRVTVEGEDYPTQVVDFGRDPSLLLTNTGNTRWGESASDPLADIALMRRRAFEKSGTGINRLTMGLEAFDRFIQDQKVKDLMQVRNVERQSGTAISALVSQDVPYEFQGVLAGGNGQARLEIYTYNEMYEDADGNSIPFMSTHDVIGTGPGLQGVRCYGAIRDKRAGLQAMPMFPKMWDQEDPSLTYTMTQSAPLMVPAQPDNSFRIVTGDGQ